MYREPLKKHTIFPNAKLCNPHAIGYLVPRNTQRHTEPSRARTLSIVDCHFDLVESLWVCRSVYTISILYLTLKTLALFFSSLSVLIWCSIGYFWIMQIRLMCWMKVSVSVYFLCVFNSGRVWSKARAWLYHINCTVWMVFLLLFFRCFFVCHGHHENKRATYEAFTGSHWHHNHKPISRAKKNIVFAWVHLCPLSYVAGEYVARTKFSAFLLCMLSKFSWAYNVNGAYKADTVSVILFIQCSGYCCCCCFLSALRNEHRLYTSKTDR